MSDRLKIDVHVRPGAGSTLARDVREGLGSHPKSIPPKHFYDERGSKLFDAICDTPEYYVTRTEQALLERIVDDVVAASGATDLVELGSGAARKTRTLLEAMLRTGVPVRYVPLDVSEEMLRESALELLEDYPALAIHGVVGDYERHLDRLPEGGRRLIGFLGSTLGNFPDAHAVAFLQNVAGSMQTEDRLLLGLDLIKSPDVLDAAYNDAQGVTAAFNKNVLAVINERLGADFDLEAFDHEAQFVPERSQVEISLRARKAQRVWIERLEMPVEVEVGEAILTEISRKFTREGAQDTLERSGMVLEQWYVSGDDYFALALARRK